MAKIFHLNIGIKKCTTFLSAVFHKLHYNAFSFGNFVAVYDLCIFDLYSKMLPPGVLYLSILTAIVTRHFNKQCPLHILSLVRNASALI